MMRRKKWQPWRTLFAIFVLVIIGITSCMKVQEYQVESDQAMGAQLKEDGNDGSLSVRMGETGEMDELELDEDMYPDEMLEMYEKYPETLPFILGYPEAEKSGKTKRDGVENRKPDIAGECHKGKIPLLIQWDQRWGYGPYGDSMIGISGCGPTCLSMVVVGLTGDTRWDPARVAAFSEEQGYMVPEVGTDWRLFSTGAEQLGLRVRRLQLQENELYRELMAGHPVICSMKPGDFTYTGHFIVLVGIDDEGEVKVNDPNSPKNSACTWPFEKVFRQIKAAWGYEAA